MPCPEFGIHVDSSCITDSADLKMPTRRNDSDQTVIRHEIEDSRDDDDGSNTDRVRRELEVDHFDTEFSQMESQPSSNISTDRHTEALIQAAARAVVASMEFQGYGHDDSILSSRTEEGYDGGTELTNENGSALMYEDDSDDTRTHDHDLYDGSASSHHEDDVFSDGDRKSNRSSMNSCTDEELHLKHGDQEIMKEKCYGVEADEKEEQNLPSTRAPSTTSTTYSLLPEPLTITGSPKPHTPSKVLSRPPFRTPSSVRAIQMSSPTPSLFNSPRSSKRPTVSRLGTPHAPSPSKTKTPNRFKSKKEPPLVLIHVTVLPLRWLYADAMDAMYGEGLPRELHGIRESWKLLKEKLGDTVLERGILLPHPQDEYQVLEERLLEALELPVRPRAKILACGHYMGPDGSCTSSSEESDNDDDVFRVNEKEKWCDICGREVLYENFSLASNQKRFRVKVYASNGLMRAGAWEAAWREMERVDVEVEPFVQSHLVQLMDSLAAAHIPTPAIEEFVAESEHDELAMEEAETRRQEMEEQRMREVYGADSRPASKMSERSTRKRHSSRTEYSDSLPELLLAAGKVALRDRKNVAIAILSVMVLLLALRSGQSSRPPGQVLSHRHIIANDLRPIVDMGAGISREVGQTVEMPAEVVLSAKSVTSEPKVVAVESREASRDKTELVTQPEDLPMYSATVPVSEDIVPEEELLIQDETVARMSEIVNEGEGVY